MALPDRNRDRRVADLAVRVDVVTSARGELPAREAHRAAERSQKRSWLKWSL